MKRASLFGVLFGIIIFLLAGFASADLLEDIGELQQQITGQELPGAIGKLFGDERVNIYVTQESGEEVVVGVITEDKKVKSLNIASVKNPTLNVYTTEAVIVKIQNSATPLKALQESLKSKEITYKAIGFWNKIKFSFTSIFVKLVGLFGSEDVQEVSSVEKVAVDEEEVKEEAEIEQEQEIAESEAHSEEVESGEGSVISGAATLDEETSEAEEESETVEEDTPETHTVKMTDDGFGTDIITIKAGDTVVWENVRTKARMNQAMIIGVRMCRAVKSDFFNPGESYQWTFDKAETCTIVDGIITTTLMKVVVE